MVEPEPMKGSRIVPSPSVQSICEEKPVRYFFSLQGLPLHLKTLEHRTTAMHLQLSLEQAIWKFQSAEKVTGLFCPVDAHGDKHPAGLATLNFFEKFSQLEVLRAIEDRLGIAVRGVAINQIAFSGLAHYLSVIGLPHAHMRYAAMPVIHTRVKLSRRCWVMNSAWG